MKFDYTIPDVGYVETEESAIRKIVEYLRHGSFAFIVSNPPGKYNTQTVMVGQDQLRLLAAHVDRLSSQEESKLNAHCPTCGKLLNARSDGWWCSNIECPDQDRIIQHVPVESARLNEIEHRLEELEEAITALQDQKTS